MHTIIDRRLGFVNRYGATIPIRFVSKIAPSTLPRRRPPRLGKPPEDQAHALEVVAVAVVEGIKKLSARPDLKQRAG